MKKFIICQSTIIALAFLFLTLTSHAQPENKHWSRPTKKTSSPVINTFVNACFDIYENEETIVLKVQSMTNGQLEGNDPQSVLNKLNECVSGLEGIQAQADVLIEAGAGMLDGVKKLSVFEYIKAYQNVTNALKVVKYSLENAKFLYDNVRGKTGLSKAKTVLAKAPAGDTAILKPINDKTIIPAIEKKRP